MWKLVLGTSPDGDDGWAGQLRGLALYDREFTGGDVAIHYRNWTNGRPEARGACNFYRFYEHAGNTIHDAGTPGIDLHIPLRYTILNRDFLEPPWKAFTNAWWYWEDVLVNIGGFVPCGFLFGIFFSSIKPVPRPKLATILFGAA